MATSWATLEHATTIKGKTTDLTVGPSVWRKTASPVFLQTLGPTVPEIQESKLLEGQCKVSTVMIWGAVTSAGVGPLCFIKSKINAAVYQEILEYLMLPSADKIYGDADFILQQNLAPAHSAKTTS